MRFSKNNNTVVLSFSLLNLTDGKLGTLQKSFDNLAFDNMTVGKVFRSYAICGLYTANNSEYIYMWKVSSDLTSVSDEHIKIDSLTEDAGNYFSYELGMVTFDKPGSTFYLFKKDFDTEDENRIYVVQNKKLTV